MLRPSLLGVVLAIIVLAGVFALGVAAGVYGERWRLDGLTRSAALCEAARTELRRMEDEALREPGNLASQAWTGIADRVRGTIRRYC
jgi:hypothetical protein